MIADRRRCLVHHRGIAPGLTQERARQRGVPLQIGRRPGHGVPLVERDRRQGLIAVQRGEILHQIVRIEVRILQRVDDLVGVEILGQTWIAIEEDEHLVAEGIVEAGYLLAHEPHGQIEEIGAGGDESERGQGARLGDGLLWGHLLGNQLRHHRQQLILGDEDVVDIGERGELPQLGRLAGDAVEIRLEVDFGIARPGRGRGRSLQMSMTASAIVRRAVRSSNHGIKGLRGVVILLP